MVLLAVQVGKTAKSTSCRITTHITPITIIGRMSAVTRTYAVAEKMTSGAKALAMPRQEETSGISMTTNSIEKIASWKIIGAG